MRGVIGRAFRWASERKDAAKAVAVRRAFERGGFKPWTPGYEGYKWDTIARHINEGDFERVVGTDRYGYRIDERVVEYPWLLSRLPVGPGVLLDAGSSLNHLPVLEHPKVAEKKVFISTLAPEAFAHWQRGVSYVYEDLRSTHLAENAFDFVACVSTIEHVGLDNQKLYTADAAMRENAPDDYLVVVDRLRELLRPGGVLYLTMPFGAYRNHGWFQVFDAAMLDRIVERFAPSSHGEEIFGYADDRWSRSDRERSSDATCFDINERGGYDDDFAAFSRAVACLELRR